LKINIAFENAGVYAEVRGIIERANERQTKTCGVVEDTRPTPSQGECGVAQNELTAGLTPSQGFMWAGAANVVLRWDKDKPCVGGCGGMVIENVDLSEGVGDGAEYLPSLVIRESCSCRKLGSGVPRTTERVDALTTSFKEVVIRA
jgi:hypothetical protein